MKKIILKTSFVLILLSILLSCSQPEGPFLATGIKIGEVTQTEAIVWVRLTESQSRVSNDAPMPEITYVDPETGEIRENKNRRNYEPIVTFPENYTIDNIQGATPGSEGKVRLKYKATGEEDWTQLDWKVVYPNHVFATEFDLSGLIPGEHYELFVEAAPLKGRKVSASLEGSFKTAPAVDIPSDVNFIVTTGTSYPDVDSETGYKLYPNSLKLDPEFFVHTGDIVYFDQMAKTLDLAKWHWDRMYSYQNNIDYHRQVSSYFIKDDHDTWMDDCFPGKETKFMGDFTYEQGTKLFLDEVPMGDKTYRTIRWGKDLQIWLVEGRDFRSRNDMEDGPEKTIWGKEQMEWFKSTVEESDATFRVLISPTPIVGPDRGSKNDNHANTGFQNEGDQLRKYLSEQKNMVTVCGDRHWQYISKDAETGLLEFSCGPGSDAHAGGWKQEDKLPEHIYLNVIGGFLEGEVTHLDGSPVLTFRHYNSNGEVVNEYALKSE